MNRMIPLAALMAATAIAATGCNRAPNASTAYNNSGTDATAAQPATNGSPTVSTTVTTTSTANQEGATGSTAAPASADASAPNAASSTAATTDNTTSGAATGAVSETVTTGKIKAAIAADSAMKDTDISVTTNNGVVSLNGTVKSQDQIAIATNLAQRQEGVQRVESNVTVR